MLHGFIDFNPFCCSMLHFVHFNQVNIFLEFSFNFVNVSRSFDVAIANRLARRSRSVFRWPPQAENIIASGSD